MTTVDDLRYVLLTMLDVLMWIGLGWLFLVLAMIVVCDPVLFWGFLDRIRPVLRVFGRFWRHIDAVCSKTQSSANALSRMPKNMPRYLVEVRAIMDEAENERADSLITAEQRERAQEQRERAQEQRETPAEPAVSVFVTLTSTLDQQCRVNPLHVVSLAPKAYLVGSTSAEGTMVCTTYGTWMHVKESIDVVDRLISAKMLLDALSENAAVESYLDSVH